MKNKYLSSRRKSKELMPVRTRVFGKNDMISLCNGFGERHMGVREKILNAFGKSHQHPLPQHTPLVLFSSSSLPLLLLTALRI